MLPAPTYPHDVFAQGNPLNPNFKLQMNPEEFFVEGRVLRIPWAEPGGTDVSENQNRDGQYVSQSNATGMVPGKFHQPIFHGIKIFVVIEPRHNSSLALQIASHGGRGERRPGAINSELAVVSTKEGLSMVLGSNIAMAREAGLLAHPIFVDPDKLDASLTAASRLNLGKVYNIEHNVPVHSFGMIRRDSMKLLYQQFQEAHSSASWLPQKTLIRRPSNHQSGKVPHSGRPDAEHLTVSIYKTISGTGAQEEEADPSMSAAEALLCFLLTYARLP